MASHCKNCGREMYRVCICTWKPEDELVYTPRPEIGDHKIERVFVWWPKRVNGRWRWLTYIFKMYEYEEKTRRYRIPHDDLMYEDGTAVYDHPCKGPVYSYYKYNEWVLKTVR